MRNDSSATSVNEFSPKKETALFSWFSEDSSDVDHEFEADIHTRLGAIRELFAMSLGTFYQMHTIFRQVTTPQIALCLAIPCAGFTGAGSSYAHYELDRQHQTDTEIDTGTEDRNPLLDADSASSSSESLSLSYGQLFMLIITAIGLANDSVGFPSNVMDLATASYLSSPCLIAITMILFLFGLAAAWAEVRACKIAMQINNGSAQVAEEDPNQKADRWSKFSISMKVMQVAVTSGLFWARVADRVLGFDTITPMGVSKQGLLVASPLTLFITCGTIFYQYYINVNNQGYFDHYTLMRESETGSKKGARTSDLPAHPLIEKTSPETCQESFLFALKITGILHDDDPENNYATRIEKILLLGRLLGSAGEFAEEITFLLAEAFSPQWLLPILFICLTVGLVISVSDARTSANNLKEHREKNLVANLPSEEGCLKKLCFSFFFRKDSEESYVSASLLPENH